MANSAMQSTPSTGAAPRTEESFVGALLVNVGSESIPALFAFSDRSSESRTVRANDEDLAVLNLFRSLTVTDPTGGSEILQTIVERVVVEMIDDESTGGISSPADHPFNLSITPVTVMRPPANRIEENGSGFGDETRFASQGMIGRVANTPVFSEFLPLAHWPN